MRLGVSLLSAFIILVSLPNQLLKHCLLKNEICLRLATNQESQSAKGYFKVSSVCLWTASVPKHNLNFLLVTLIFSHFLGFCFPSWETQPGELEVAMAVFCLSINNDKEVNIPSFLIL